MRVGVVGAGAIGGFIAAALARAGTDVAVVARGAHLEAIRRNGLEVESDFGRFTVKMPASDDLRTLGSFDTLLLTFKAHQWAELLPQLAPFSRTATTIVTLQNGLPFWFARTPPLQSVDPGGAIGALFPDDQIIGGVVHVSGHIAAPGHIRQSGGTRYPLAEVNGGTERVAQLSAVLRAAGLTPEEDPHIRTTLWLKLVNNTGLNPVSALEHMTVHGLIKNPRTRADVRELMEESLAVGRALGVVDGVDVDANLAYAARLTDVKTSMLQDLEAHRPLEIDPILGAVVELGDRLRVPVPRLRSVYEQLINITAGTHG